MYMYKVGGKDLYEGLQQAAELFLKYSIDRYDAVTNLHTVSASFADVLFGCG